MWNLERKEYMVRYFCDLCDKEVELGDFDYD